MRDDWKRGVRIGLSVTVNVKSSTTVIADVNHRRVALRLKFVRLTRRANRIPDVHVPDTLARSLLCLFGACLAETKLAIVVGWPLASW